MEQFNLQPDELGSLPLKLIDPDPEQPRKDFDDDYLDQLAASIKVDGVIQPIVLRNNPEQPGRFFLVAGENRWRASKLARKHRIPAVLREVSGLNKLLIQLKENHQRKDLNPMEWALAFQTMHKTHGLKQAEIEKTLKESGVGQFGRAYISNIIRLLGLPEWAQNLIRYGKLTPAHGKYLIPAMASDKVISRLETELTQIDAFDKDVPTTSEIQREIYLLFNSYHPDLTNWETKFDYRKKCVATGCQKMRKISSPHSESTFCLDKQCYAIFQAEAMTKREKSKVQIERENSNAGEPREITISDDNRVNVDEQQLQCHRDWRLLEFADFDVSTCDGCKHRHIAVEDDDTEDAQHSDGCFLVSCYLEKHDKTKRASRLLEQYVTGILTERVADDPITIARLTVWIAARCPAGVVQNNNGEFIHFSENPLDWDEEEDLEKVLFKNGLLSFKRFVDASNEQFKDLVGLLINSMPISSEAMQELWQCFKLSIDDYRIDEHFLAEHTEEEVKALFDTPDIPPVSFAELENACSEGKLDQFVLEHRDMVGIPSEIRFAWEKLAKEDEEDEQ